MAGVLAVAGQQSLRADIVGDVAPDGKGDGRVSLIDWIRMGRLVVGLDELTGFDEFLRADCAPRVSGGDGVISVGELVQVARYMSGLDDHDVWQMQHLFASPAWVSDVDEPIKRQVRLQTSAFTNSVWTLGVILDGAGDENALSFSVHFDPSKQTLLTYSNGSGGAVTTNLRYKGDFGIVLSLAPNQTFPAEPTTVMTLRFLLDANFHGSSEVEFRSWPAGDALSDADGNALEAVWTGASISNPAFTQPTLDVRRFDARLEVSWPQEGSDGFRLERSESLGHSTWVVTEETPVAIAGRNRVVFSIDGGSGWFRLRKP